MSKKSGLIVGLTAGTALGVVGSMLVTALADTQAPVEKELVAGAPKRVLIDNDSMTVTLVSFPEGFKREGGFKRRAEQLIVYVDDGEFKTVPRPGAAPNPNAGKRGPESPITPEGEVSRGGVHPRGTVAWHPKDSMTGTLQIGRAYRALYIELKK